MRLLALLAIASFTKAEGNGVTSDGADPEVENWSLAKSILWLWTAILVTLMVYTFYRNSIRYMRTIACLTNKSQIFFQRPHFFYGQLRSNFLDAPLLRRRHHREFRLSKAINMGSVPSRMQTLFLLGYLIMMVTLTTVYIDWSAPLRTVLSVVIMRTGYMAVMNMLPLFLFAGRNNPLIVFTGISFDTYNLIHRWLGRIVVLEVVVHGVAWVVSSVARGGWKRVQFSESHGSFILSGTIAASALVAILLQSPSAVRHAFYEIFLAGHIILVNLVVGAVWIHLKEESDVIRHVFFAAVSFWVFDRVARFARLLYRNVGAGGSRAEVEVMPGDALRVTVKIARPWRVRPGQHAYLYMPAIGLLTSHPFTVAWSETAESTSDRGRASGDEEEAHQPAADHDSQVLSEAESKISFIIRRRTGFTNALFKKAKREGGKISALTYVEGPYGSQSLSSYGTVLLFAAGVGITHHVPHVRQLVSGFGNSTVAARKIVLVWVIQSPSHLEWIRPWMTSILAIPHRREVLRVLIFVTRPRSMKETHSPSSSVQIYPGRPDLQALVDHEVDQSVGAVGVSVCGVGSFADDVRSACRRWMGVINLDLMEESFSW